jgi:uroporphyrinogen decarboxylase
MNSRQRVLAALNHKQPDRVPIDFSGHRSSGIAAIAYARLRRHLGLAERPIRVYDMVQQLAIVDEDVLDLFGVDVVEMGRGFLTGDSQWKDWVLPDGTPCQIPYYINLEKRGEDWYLVTDGGLELGVQKKGVLYFEQTSWPLMERGIADDDFSDLEEVLGRTIWSGTPHPGAHISPDDPEAGRGGEAAHGQDARATALSRGARRLRERTDRAIVGLFGGNLFELPQWLYRMDNYLMYMGLYPEQVIRLSEALCAIYMTNLEKWLAAVGPYIDVILFGDDLGGQNGPLMSPQMYRRYYKPYHKRLWTRAKELADVKVQLHCCGGVRELLPDLIDAGLDALNPVQITCRGMDAAGLKRDFGSRITFWGGGCDTREVLGSASPAQVREHVKRQIEILAPGGGFVFQQVHNILANVPPANIVAMFDAVKECS